MNFINDQLKSKKHIIITLIRFCLLLQFFLLRCSCFAQTFQVKGTVFDSAKNYQLKGARIILAPKQNSYSLEVATDQNGNFNFKNVSPGQYLLSVSYVGFEGHKEKLNIINSNLNLKLIKLTFKSINLEEAIIKQQVKPTIQKNDTLEYNANAYKVHSNANTEDLLQKMPMLDIDETGITTQGEKVQKLLIDGKEYFGDNIEITLKSFPSDQIKKVQIFNEKTVQDDFSGFNNNSTAKVINLVTQGQNGNTLFGKIYGGYGTSNRYMSGGVINSFTQKRKISLIGEWNNCNLKNGNTDLNSTGTSGTTEYKSLGVSYSDKWGKRIDVSGSYQYSELSNSLERDQKRQYYLNFDSGQIYTENIAESVNTISHKLNFRIAYDIDSLNSISYDVTASLLNNHLISDNTENTYQNNILLNNTRFNLNDSLKTGDLYNHLFIGHRFKKNGRTLSLDFKENNNGSKENFVQAGETTNYQSSFPVNLNNQLGKIDKSTSVLTSNLSYTEPLSKKVSTELYYKFRYAPSYSNKNISENQDSSAVQTINDSLLYNEFRTTSQKSIYGFHVNIAEKKYKFWIGVDYEQSVLHSVELLPSNSTFDNRFKTFLPTWQFQYFISKRQNLYLNYTTNTYAPSIIQLQNVVDDVNPLHLFIGNPYLKQSYNQNVILRYNSTSQSGMSICGVLLSYSFMKNPISTNTYTALSDTTLPSGIFLEKGQQLSSLINLNNSWNLHATLAYSNFIEFIKSSININITTGLTELPSIINYQTNILLSKSFNYGMSLTSNISENIDFNIASNSLLTISNNTINPNLDEQIFNESIRGKFDFSFWKIISLKAELQYQYFSGLLQTNNTSYLFCNAGLYKAIFKNKKGEIRVSAYNVLNVKTDISNVVTENYLSNTKTNSQQRFFMLSFLYTIK